MARTINTPVIPADCTRMGKRELIAYGRKSDEQRLIAGLEMLRRRTNRVANGKLSADDAIVASVKDTRSAKKAARTLFDKADARLAKQVANTRKA